MFFNQATEKSQDFFACFSGFNELNQLSSSSNLFKSDISFVRRRTSSPAEIRQSQMTEAWL
jgi:hypothetical protein